MRAVTPLALVALVAAQAYAATAAEAKAKCELRKENPWKSEFAKDFVQVQAGDDLCLTRDYILNLLFLHECVEEGQPGFEDQHFTFIGGRFYSRDVGFNLCLTRSETCRKPFKSLPDLQCAAYFTGCAPNATTLGQQQIWEAQEQEDDCSGSFFFLRQKATPPMPKLCLHNAWDHSKQIKPAKDFPIDTYTCNEKAQLEIFYSYRALASDTTQEQ